jgi:O-antigen ligase
VIVFLGCVSVVLGLLQVAQGPDSSLRFFEFTNTSESVGFFANRNHFAALMYVTLLLTSPWLIGMASGMSRKATLRTSNVLFFVMIIAIVVAVTAALAMARSRAGIVLAMAAFAGLVVISISIRNAQQRLASGNASKSSYRFIFGLLAFAIFFAAQFGLGRMLTRFEQDPLEDLRFALARTTWDAAWSGLPFGKGLGSFVPVYSVFERPADLFGGFANRAHNDFAELFLELGVFGVAIMFGFLIWFVARVFWIWRQTSTTSPAGTVLARAGTLCIALLLVHSLVDYPLRTTAMSVVFAFCCGLLMPAIASRHAESPTGQHSNEHSGEHSSSSHIALSATEAAETPKPRSHVKSVDGIFGVEWPDDWKKK